jgi:hypothetical protein
MWLVTGAYAEHRVELGGPYPFLDGAFSRLWRVVKRQKTDPSVKYLNAYNTKF